MSMCLLLGFIKLFLLNLIVALLSTYIFIVLMFKFSSLSRFWY